MNKKKYNDNSIIYQSNLSTDTTNYSTSNICYSYQEISEELSNKEIFPFVKKK